MDSPRSVRICILLLTTAACRANTALFCDKPAERTQDSLISTTNVTVYYYKTWEHNMCESSSYEGFEIIAETQTKTFSNKIIQLETNETVVIMCFHQENTFPAEGIYSIFWEKADGVGDSCGILNSRAFSENVTHNKICCRAEIDIFVPNQTLRCYTEMSNQKLIITEEDPGNPRCFIDKKTIIIISLLLFGVCAVALALLCVQRKQKSQGGENEQSTEIISVWEGDSINITCSIEASGNDLGTHLTTSIQPVNVIRVYKQSTRIPPALANRTQYSREGKNLRVTLHRAQESDSNIYLCLKYSKNKGYHEKLYGKTTIVVVKGNASGVVEQSPAYVTRQQGQSVTISCAFHSSQEDKEIYLLRTHVHREKVLHVSSQNASTLSPAFANRLEYSKEEKKIIITLHSLQKNDSDIYVCARVETNASFLSANGSGTMMLITDEEQRNCSNSSWGIYGLVIVVVLLSSALICCTLYRVNMKKYFQKRNPNNVYEDMSYTSRCNTLVRTNTCSTDN